MTTIENDEVLKAEWDRRVQGSEWYVSMELTLSFKDKYYLETPGQVSSPGKRK